MPGESEGELYLRTVKLELNHLKPSLFCDIVKFGPTAFARSGTSDETHDGRETGEIKHEISAVRSDAWQKREVEEVKLETEKA